MSLTTFDFFVWFCNFSLCFFPLSYVILCSVVCLLRGAGSLLAGCVCFSVCRHGGCYLGLASTVICTQQFQKIPLVPPATVAPANAVVNGNDTTFHQIHILPPPPPPPPHSHQPLLPLFTSFGYNRSPVTTPQGDTPTAPGTCPLFIIIIIICIIIIIIIVVVKTSRDASHWCFSEISARMKFLLVI